MPDATLTQPSNAAPPAPPAGKPRKPASKKQVRTVVIASVTAAALAVGGYFLYRFLTKNDSAGAEMQTVVADYGSIQSKASGSGNAKAKENAAITLSAGGHGAGRSLWPPETPSPPDSLSIPFTARAPRTRSPPPRSSWTA